MNNREEAERVGKLLKYFEIENGDEMTLRFYDTRDYFKTMKGYPLPITQNEVFKNIAMNGKNPDMFDLSEFSPRELCVCFLVSSKTDDLDWAYCDYSGSFIEGKHTLSNFDFIWNLKVKGGTFAYITRSPHEIDKQEDEKIYLIKKGDYFELEGTGMENPLHTPYFWKCMRVISDGESITYKAGLMRTVKYEAMSDINRGISMSQLGDNIVITMQYYGEKFIIFPKERLE